MKSTIFVIYFQVKRVYTLGNLDAKLTGFAEDIKKQITNRRNEGPTQEDMILIGKAWRGVIENSNIVILFLITAYLLPHILIDGFHFYLSAVLGILYNVNKSIYLKIHDNYLITTSLR